MFPNCSYLLWSKFLRHLTLRLAATRKYSGSPGDSSPSCEFPEVQIRQIWLYSRSMKRCLGWLINAKAFLTSSAKREGQLVLREPIANPQAPRSYYPVRFLGVSEHNDEQFLSDFPDTT